MLKTERLAMIAAEIAASEIETVEIPVTSAGTDYLHEVRWNLRAVLSAIAEGPVERIEDLWERVRDPEQNIILLQMMRLQ